ncbi:MAG TPA: hypothetical protein VGQ49_05415 [Bryobacteraceae bacterium]|nr:hypothetical protein [Bryobacteraceae bacterium]
MADFRRCLYALALVALLAGLTVPASAQAFQCQTNTSNVPLVRAEGYTELLGDILLDCTGGIPTAPNQSVPTVNLTVALDQGVNITSQVTAIVNSVEFLEALVIIDEPNSPSNPTRPLLNCGRTSAPDNTPAGAGVCPITGDGVHGGGSTGAANTYDGTANHPNVFQGRSFRLIGGAPNQMVFSGLPVDPPGTVCPNQPSQPLCHRFIRITNIRGDATAVAVVSSTNTRPINASLNANPFSGLPVDAQSRPIATVQLGLSGGLNAPKLDFIQCSQLGPTPGNPGQSQNLIWTFQESFNNVFKAQSLTQTLNNGTAKPNYKYNGGVGLGGNPNTQQGVLLNQNVPGAVYDSESGFVNAFAATQGDNPSNPLTGTPGAGVPFDNTGGAANTGFAKAGIASQGTRLWLGFSSIQAGTSVSVPNVIALTSVVGGAQTGVAVLINGANANSGFGGSPAGPGSTTVAGAGTGGFAVYEVFFADPTALERAAIKMTVSGFPNLPLNLPTPGAPPSQVTGSFAPFYAQVPGVREAAFLSGSEVTGVPGVLAGTLPIPRFLQLAPAVTLFQINRCSCNLLFPYVTNAPTVGGAFDTGIAIANTSFDPGGSNGFFGSQQSGPVQLWFYNKNNGAAPAEPNFGNGQLNTQCTNSTTPGSCGTGITSVPAGGLLTYSLFFGGVINALPAATPQVLLPANTGLPTGVTGFTGYIIAQARFQYCHGFAYISKQGAGFNDSTNTSMGYLAIVLDRPAGTIALSPDGLGGFNGSITLGLPRTASSPGENDGH